MKQHRQKITSLLLALFMFCMTVTGCGLQQSSDQNQSSQEQQNQKQETAMSQVTDYADSSSWAMYEEGTGSADVFFICPTVDLGESGNYNMSLDNNEVKESFLGASKMELGIYDEDAAVYAPYYQQVTFPAYSLEAKESEPYFDIAYSDVSAAFQYYLDHCDADRPLILAGFSQGSDMLIRLMKEYFSDEKLMNRLVAAYAIGWRLTTEDVEACPWLVPAEAEDDTGCIITINSEAENVTNSLLVPEGEWTYSINPLNWKTDSTPADKSLNKGACFTDYSGGITQEIPEITGAYLDPVRGTLKCPDINAEDYSNSLFEDGIYHLYDYQFFYRNLQDNVKTRLNAWSSK